MSDNEEDNLAVENCLRILRALVGKGVEFGIPDTPVARFEWVCCLVLMASYIASKGESSEKVDKIIDYVSNNRNLLLESPAYTEVELKHILDYRRLYFCSLNTNDMAYVLAELIDKATKYGHFVRLKNGEESQISKDDFDSLKSYRLLEYVASDARLASFATSLSILSNPLGVLREVIAEKANEDVSLQDSSTPHNAAVQKPETPEVSVFPEKKAANTHVGESSEIEGGSGEVATEQYIKITTMLTESALDYGLPNTSVARFELRCYIICKICDVVTGGKFTELTEEILDYVSSHRELLSNSPNFTKSELKDILAYRLGMYMGMPTSIAVIALGRMIDAANRHGHLTEVKRGDYDLIDGGVDSSKLTPFLSDMMFGAPCVALSVFLLHNVNLKEAVRFSQSIQKEAIKSDNSIAKSFANSLRKPSKSSAVKAALKTPKQSKKSIHNLSSSSGRDSIPESPLDNSGAARIIYIGAAILIGVVMVICALSASMIRKNVKKDVRNMGRAQEVSLQATPEDSIATKTRTTTTNNRIESSARAKSSKNARISKSQAQEALWKAVSESNEAAVRKAVADGADVNAWKYETMGKISVLQYAVGTANYKMTKCLIDLGADVNVKIDNFPNLWSFIVRQKKSEDAERIIVLLINQGLDINAPAIIDGASVQDSIDKVAGGVAKNFASFSNTVDDMEKEIRSQAEKALSGKDIRIPILTLCAKNGYTSAVQLLLERGANPNAEVSTSYGSAVYAAAFSGHAKIAEILISHGAHFDEMDEVSGTTPLHVAAAKGFADVVDVLLKHGASLTTATRAGGKALHLAAFSGKPEVIECMMKHGASVTEKNELTGHSALRWAIEFKHFEAARLLVDLGSPLEEPDKEGVTDAMMLVILGDEEDPMWKGLLEDEQHSRASRALIEWAAKYAQ